VVYDTVGSPESIETALRLVATGGEIAVSGVEAPRRFEWTPLYFKEVRLRGSNAFGVEELRGRRQHAFAHYFDLVAEGFDATAAITHRFPLARWQDAYLAIARRARTGAVKVLLEP
jgi:threonine dehydrogenase-like Zn-dependent dehydrogenase